MDLAWFIVLALGLLLGGYIWGRRLGLQEGIKLGHTIAPLKMRQESLEKGYCLLCKEPLDRENIYPSSSLML